MTQTSIIIPTYNESENIPILIEKLNQVLQNMSFEVIFIDDNSPDKTWEIARELSQKYPWVRVIRRMHEKGLSSAVITGFSIAEGDYFIVMDADLQHDEKIIPTIIENLIHGQDIVIGSRKVDGGGTKNWSNTRKFISWTATIMSKIALKYNISDPMSGFFGLRKEVYSNYKDDINPKGFKILLEYLGRTKNLKIKEVGYTFSNRLYGESKLSGKVIFDYIKALYELSIGNYIPVKFIKYSIVGLSGLFVSNIVLYLCLKQFNLTNSNALFYSIELSILTNFILNNYWTFKENKLTGFWAFSRGLITFHAICFSGALINHSIALKLVNYNSLNLYFTNAIGYIVAAVWNYAINIGITWKENRRK